MWGVLWALSLISIHALHEESDKPMVDQITAMYEISIHALHEESDLEYLRLVLVGDISIHALHEESDPLVRPTVPLGISNFNPRSP